MWKLVNNQQPKCLKEKFPLKINEAIINNPNNNKMIILHRRNTTGKRSLSYEGYELWNLEIPEYIRSQKILSRFSRSYHAYHNHVHNNQALSII